MRYKYGDKVTVCGLNNELEGVIGNIIEFDVKINMYKIQLEGSNKLDRIIVAVREDFLK